MGQGYKGWAGGDQVDWDKVDSGSPTPLERGIYSCQVMAVTPQDTKDGKPSLALELEIQSKYGSDDDIPKRKLFDTFTMTTEGLFKTKQFCEATDIEPPASTTYGDVCDFTEDMLDQEVYVLVGVRTFEGRPRNRVEFYIHDSDVKEVLEKESAAGGRSSRPSRGRERTRAADAKSEGKSEGKSERRRSRDDEDDDRSSRRRSRGEGEERRSRGRDRDDDDRGSDDDRDRDDDRGRDRDDEDRGSRRRGRDREETRESRSKDDDRDSDKSSNGASTRGTEDIEDEGGEEPRRARRRRRGRAAAEQE